ncbi:MAG: hypothetical protein IKQ03_08375 [Prevotella sp.]|nr:hypothetical protein [Prevotella sp.]
MVPIYLHFQDLSLHSFERLKAYLLPCEKGLLSHQKGLLELPKYAFNEEKESEQEAKKSFQPAENTFLHFSKAKTSLLSTKELSEFLVFILRFPNLRKSSKRPRIKINIYKKQVFSFYHFAYYCFFRNFAPLFKIMLCIIPLA